MNNCSELILNKKKRKSSDNNEKISKNSKRTNTSESNIEVNFDSSLDLVSEIQEISESEAESDIQSDTELNTYFHILSRFYIQGKVSSPVHPFNCLDDSSLFYSFLPSKNVSLRSTSHSLPNFTNNTIKINDKIENVLKSSPSYEKFVFVSKEYKQFSEIAKILTSNFKESLFTEQFVQSEIFFEFILELQNEFFQNSKKTFLLSNQFFKNHFTFLKEHINWSFVSAIINRYFKLKHIDISFQGKRLVKWFGNSCSILGRPKTIPTEFNFLLKIFYFSSVRIYSDKSFNEKNLIDLTIKAYNKMFPHNMITENSSTILERIIHLKEFSFRMLHQGALHRLRAELDNLNYISLGLTARFIKENIHNCLLVNIDATSITYNNDIFKYLSLKNQYFDALLKILKGLHSEENLCFKEVVHKLSKIQGNDPELTDIIEMTLDTCKNPEMFAKFFKDAKGKKLEGSLPKSFKIVSSCFANGSKGPIFIYIYVTPKKMDKHSRRFTKIPDPELIIYIVHKTKSNDKRSKELFRKLEGQIMKEIFIILSDLIDERRKIYVLEENTKGGILFDGDPTYLIELLDKEFLDSFRLKNVELIKIAASCTAIFQPLDVSVLFKNIKSKIKTFSKNTKNDEHMKLIFRNYLPRIISAFNFDCSDEKFLIFVIILLISAYMNSYNRENIINSWIRSGLLNPECYSSMFTNRTGKVCTNWPNEEEINALYENFIARGFVPETTNDPRITNSFYLNKFKFNCLEKIDFGRQNITRDGSISNYRFTIITNGNFYEDYKSLDKNYKIGDEEPFTEDNYALFPGNDDYHSRLTYNNRCYTIEDNLKSFLELIFLYKRG